ncbi:urease accessory protein UreH domain-containing protein [Clostridium psychrophilum]|uniref:urease accessory protein UreH domain-containing protein n=1 Tax=Clostridium psychrophilum TaxID=132926 RepID=UPI001C0D3EDF|nr:sulfite exporter TauE/SafE family protein [Clostridium psychrophilum]MBU3179756.1 sulfite exporter TauE/SafE family protein [Clostridium psychrophilum]
MSNKKQKIKVYNMTCSSCESRIEKALMNVPGVIMVLADYKNESIFLKFDDDLCTIELIKKTISKLGYNTDNSSSFRLIGMLIIILAIYLLSRIGNSFDMNSKLTNASYLVLFIVGIFTSLHCVGMCGGIMLSQSMSSISKNKFESLKPDILYNLGRVISYTVLGLIMGNRGLALSGINISPIAFTSNTSKQTNSSKNITKATVKNGVQVINMIANTNGYTPSVLYVQKNVPVKLEINGEQLTSCNNTIVLPSVNIEKKLK